jgi:hypothetical protein
MSEPTFEMRCPACGSVFPADASGCPNCDKSRIKAAGPAVAASASAAEAPNITAMPVKEYHRMVRANYRAVEGPRVGTARAGGFRIRTYLPFLLLLIGLAVGAALAFGRI